MAAALALLVTSSNSLAQRRRGGGGAGGGLKMATEADFEGAFLFCRIAFRRNPFGDGSSWAVDYPRADINLSFRLSELTTTPISRDPDGEINHVVLRLTDPLLYRCPFIMMTEVGAAYFDEQEAAALHDYLLKGGFLWADDFWGHRAWDVWAGEMAKVMPPGEYPLVELAPSHDLFHVLYDVRRVPQIPGIGYWGGPGGSTSERGADSARAEAHAIFDHRGRIMVLSTHNTDFGDAFEREGDDYQYFLTFAPEGYAFGVNALLYSMTH